MTKFTKKILDHIQKHPKEKAKDTAIKFNVSVPYIYQLRAKLKDMGEVQKPKETVIDPKVWKVVHVSTSDNSIEQAMHVEMHEPPSDPVNHPAHYKVGGIETIDFIEAKRLNYNLGNAVKYITRADHKGNRKQDLEKAIWYLTRELSHG